MQRVRIGLTGLAFIFVLVMLAAVFSSPSDEEPITANGIEQQRANAGAVPSDGAAAGPKEPLAELGVAPGSDSNAAASEPAVAAVPQP
jgi:hypothetical protein